MMDVGYILHRRSYRETSVIIHTLTHEHGLMDFVVRGARQSNTRGKVSLQAFTPLSFEWRKPTDMPTLYNVEATGIGVLLQGTALVSGLYANELLLRVLQPGDSYEAIFFAYHKLLQQLVQPATVLDAYLRRFELSVLANLGYGLALNADAATFEPQQFYRYDPRHGFSSTTLENHESVFAGRVLLAIAHDDYTDKVTRNAAKQLTRLALRPLLGDRPLRTKELFYGATTTTDIIGR